MPHTILCKCRLLLSEDAAHNGDGDEDENEVEVEVKLKMFFLFLASQDAQEVMLLSESVSESVSES